MSKALLETSEFGHFRGVIALELAVGAAPQALIDKAAAQALAQSLAAELQRHLHTLHGLGLVWMAAAFDSAQILRPGFPVHRELLELYRAAVRDPLREPQILTLTALRGAAPSPALQPDVSLYGSLLHLPFAIVGPKSLVAAASETLELHLMDAGLVDARMARTLVDGLQCKLEHARLMSLDDLCALTAANLAHLGLDLGWSVLEHSLFKSAIAAHWSLLGLKLRWSPGESLGQANGQTNGQTDGQTADELPSLSVTPASFDPLTCEAYITALRQCLPLWIAHAISVRLVSEDPRMELDADAGYWIQWLQQPSLGLRQRQVDFDQARLGYLLLETPEGLPCAYAVPLHRDGWRALHARLQRGH